MIFSGGSLY